MKRKLKHGVKLAGLAPEMAIADAIVAGVYAEAGAAELVITSALDGEHMPGSRHYDGCALDYRRWELDGLEVEWMHILDQLRHRLGRQFDVILHGTHLHVEFDPVRRAPGRTVTA